MIKPKRNSPPTSPRSSAGALRALAGRVPWTYIAAAAPVALVLTVALLGDLGGPDLRVAVERADGRSLGSGEALGPDEPFRVAVRTARAGYLYVLLTDFRGRVRVLHPRGGGREAARVAGGTEVAVPTDGRQLRPLRTGVGTRAIVALLSDRPRDPLAVVEHVHRTEPEDPRALARAGATVGASFRAFASLPLRVGEDAEAVQVSTALP